MSETQTHLPTDTWICASWQEYEQAIANLLNDIPTSELERCTSELQHPSKKPETKGNP